VRAIQDHKVIEWNTCWKCRLLEDTDAYCGARFIGLL
jgi:hypothetical protein